MRPPIRFELVFCSLWMVSKLVCASLEKLSNGYPSDLYELGGGSGLFLGAAVPCSAPPFGRTRRTARHSPLPAKNGAASEWALPISATYIYAYTDSDYRDRADPSDVLAILKRTAAAA